MLGDLRFALRVLANDKGWTTIVVLSLALGIGANTAIFSAINGLLLKTIPVTGPGYARAPEVCRAQRHGDES